MDSSGHPSASIFKQKNGRAIREQETVWTAESQVQISLRPTAKGGDRAMGPLRVRGLLHEEALARRGGRTC